MKIKIFLNALKLWRLLKKISEAPIHEMHDLQVEAKELIEKI